MIRETVLGLIEKLKSLQKEDGRFEGLLSSNTYPTCSFAVIEMMRGEAMDEGIAGWLIERQLPDGMWPLDTSNRGDEEATALVRTVISAALKRGDDPRLRDALRRSPDIRPSLFHVKLMGALCGELGWGEVLPGRALRTAVKLLSLLPRPIRSKLKPPLSTIPPPELFRTPIFDDLFIAEQHTLVPILLIAELKSRGRTKLAEELLSWLLERRLPDGSWFRVNFITALSVMALMTCREEGIPGLERPIEEGIAWLEGTRNPDGGFREAINLNVWDTALSVCSLLEAGVSADDPSIKRACEWLISVQNGDGGWPFSGVDFPGLPSDADDTALSALALIKAGYGGSEAVSKGVRWLIEHQRPDGGWGTYVPGAGDVGCVSITAHAAEALKEAGREGEAEKALNWLERSADPNGSWDDLWLARRTYGTACAVAALVKCGRRGSPAVEKGIEWLKSVQNPDGGWGEDMSGGRTASAIEQTAWSVYALILAEGGISEEARKGLEFLKRRWETGDWRPSPVGIYWEVIGGYEDPIYAFVFPIMAFAAAHQHGIHR